MTKLSQWTSPTRGFRLVEMSVADEDERLGRRHEGALSTEADLPYARGPSSRIKSPLPLTPARLARHAAGVQDLEEG